MNRDIPTASRVAIGLIVFLLSIGFIVISTRELVITAETAEIVFLAKNVEESKIFPLAIISLYARNSHETIIKKKICRSDFVKAGATLVLMNLDLQDSESDYPGWELALSTADEYIRAAIACLPTSGNLWARLAMLKLAAGEDPKEVGRLMTIAQRLAPAEINELTNRLRIWNRVSEPTLNYAKPAVLKDLAVARSNIAYGELKTVNESLSMKRFLKRVGN